MIYDLTLFFHKQEADILELRLGSHYDWVDKFIVAEAKHTFMGDNKGYYFEDTIKDPRYAKFLDKIEYVKVDYTKEFGDPKTKPGLDGNEDITRLRPLTHIESQLKDDDILIISDLDEIFMDNILEYFTDRSKPAKINCMKFEHYFNTLEQQSFTWNWPFIVTWGTLKKYIKIIESQHPWPLHAIRDYRNTDGFVNFLPDNTTYGGWHFSSCFTSEESKYKLQSYSDKWNATDTNLDLNTLTERRNSFMSTLGENEMLLLTGDQMETVLPEYLLDNKQRFSHRLY